MLPFNSRKPFQTVSFAKTRIEKGKTSHLKMQLHKAKQEKRLLV